MAKVIGWTILLLSMVILMQFNAAFVNCHRAEFNNTVALVIHNVNGKEYVVQKINDKIIYFENVIKNNSQLFTIDLRKSVRKNAFLQSLNELVKDSSRTDHSIQVFIHNNCPLMNQTDWIKSYITLNLINDTIMVFDKSMPIDYVNLTDPDAGFKLELSNETILANKNVKDFFKSIRFSFMYYNYILFVSIDRGLIYYFNVEDLFTKSIIIEFKQINIYQVFIDMNNTGFFYEFLDIFRNPILIEEILLVILVFILVIGLPSLLIRIILVNMARRRARRRFTSYQTRINYLQHQNAINQCNDNFDPNYPNSYSQYALY